MAKRERNKRSARKARQQERERVAAAQAVAEASQPKKKKLVKKSAGKPAAKKAAISKADRRGVQKVTGYFSDVRAEMHQVTWPTRLELRNYSVAVIISLIIFGLFIWLVDTGFVAGLVQYVGLRG
ncbi:MAG: preprotein translocase subunit SecE [Coriobacteriales bacterium]|nr:preprotein translocase subunit SecE [Coriobacteriales bacterium]